MIVAMCVVGLVVEGCTRATLPPPFSHRGHAPPVCAPFQQRLAEGTQGLGFGGGRATVTGRSTAFEYGLWDDAKLGERANSSGAGREHGICVPTEPCHPFSCKGACGGDGRLASTCLSFISNWHCRGDCSRASRLRHATPPPPILPPPPRSRGGCGQERRPPRRGSPTAKGLRRRRGEEREKEGGWKRKGRGREDGGKERRPPRRRTPTR